jgi:hypothetical protein
MGRLNRIKNQTERRFTCKRKQPTDASLRRQPHLAPAGT